jgi:hypothetical protein
VGIKQSEKEKERKENAGNKKKNYLLANITRAASA